LGDLSIRVLLTSVFGTLFKHFILKKNLKKKQKQDDPITMESKPHESQHNNKTITLLGSYRAKIETGPKT
jgi:hypothetical protein